MTTAYDEYLGGRGNISYLTNADVEYPDSVERNIFGTTLLPRVYGKDLDAFEIASTGLVALTLKEIHSLDIKRDVSASNVSIETLCNDSLKFDVNSSNVFIQMDGQNNNLDIYTDADTIIEANSNLTLQVNENVFETTVNNGAIYTRMDSAGAIFRSHTDSNYEVTASNDISVEADKNMTLTTNTGTFKNTVSDDSVYVTMDAASKRFYSHTDSNYDVTASNNVTVEADKDMTLTTNQGTFKNTVSDDALYVTMDTADKRFHSHTDSNYDVTASNNVTVEADKDMTLTTNTGTFKNTVSDDALFVTMDTADKRFHSHTDSNYDVTASNNVTVEADKDMTLTTNQGTFKNTVSDDSVYVTMDAASKRFYSHTDSNYEVTASNDIAVEADKDMTLTTNQGIFKNTVSDDSVYVTMDATSKRFYSHTDSNYEVTASNDIAVEADKDMTLTTNTGTFKNTVSDDALFVTMDTADKRFHSHTDSNYDVTASNNVTVEADKDMTLTTNQGTFKNTVSDDALFVTMDATSKRFHSHTDSNYEVTASNNVMVEAANSVTVSAVDGSSDLEILMMTDANTIYYKSTGEHDFSVNDDTKMKIDDTGVSFTMDDFIHSGSNFSTSNEVSFGMASKEYGMIQVNDDANNINNYINFNASSNIKTHTTGAHQFYVDSTRLMTITNSNVNIFGNLNVEGTLNSVSVSETKLDVQDSLIRLATSSNFVNNEDDDDSLRVPYDGVLNDGAGIWITGIPQDTTVPSAYEYRHELQDFYEKSLRWHNSTGGMLELGKNKPTEESYWELKGGPLYITHMPIDASGEKKSDISFGFRINTNGELELVKKYKRNETDNNYMTKIVARFGSTLTL